MEEYSKQGKDLSKFIDVETLKASDDVGPVLAHLQQHELSDIADGEERGRNGLAKDQYRLQSAEGSAQAAADRIAGITRNADGQIIDAEGKVLTSAGDTTAYLQSIFDRASDSTADADVSGATGAMEGKRLSSLYGMLGEGGEDVAAKAESQRALALYGIDRDGKLVEQQNDVEYGASHAKVGQVDRDVGQSAASLAEVVAQEKVKELHLNKQWNMLAAALGKDEATIHEKVAALPHILETNGFNAKKEVHVEAGTALAATIDLIEHMEHELEESKKRHPDDTAQLLQVGQSIDEIMEMDHIKSLRTLQQQDERAQQLLEAVTAIQLWGYQWHQGTVAWRQEVVDAFTSLGRNFTTEVDATKTGFNHLVEESQALVEKQKAAAAKMVEDEENNEAKEQSSWWSKLGSSIKSYQKMESTANAADTKEAASLQSTSSSTTAAQLEGVHHIDGVPVNIDEYLKKAGGSH